MIYRSTPVIIGGLLAATSVRASAKDVTVQLEYQSADGTMMPELPDVKAAQGHVIHCKPTNSRHIAETISIMLPDGAPPMKDAMNKEAALAIKHGRPS